MGELRVRRASAEDAIGLATVRVRTWQSAYRGIVPDTYLDSMSLEANVTQARGWFEKASPATHWVCVDNGHVVGWACTLPQARDPDVGDSTAELVACYALDRVWGRGVGFKMWHEARKQLVVDGAKRVVLWVLADNERAIRFYERQGFRADGAKKTETLAGSELVEIRLIVDL